MDQPEANLNVVDAEVVSVADAEMISTPRGAGGNPFSAFVCWLIILGVTGFLFFVHNFVEVQPTADELAGNERLELVQVNLMAKFIVGVRSLTDSEDFGIKELAIEPSLASHRLCKAILVSEFDGVEKGLGEIRQLKSDIADGNVSFNESTQQSIALIEQLCSEYQNGQWNAPGTSEQERQTIIDNLGWCGRLALAPKEAADSLQRQAVERTALNNAITAMVLVIGLLATLAGGLFVFVVGMILLVTRKIKLRFNRHPVTTPYHVYAETFAVWFILFLVFTSVAGLVDLGPYQLLASGVAILFTLTALVWPCLRGVPFGQVMTDIGWQRSNLFGECAAGIGGYLFSIPIFLAGIACAIAIWMMTSLMNAASLMPLAAADDQAPVHPIMFDLLRGDLATTLSVYFLASVVAPIVEETMFRGVLYRHLRDASSLAPRLVSVLFSAVLGGLIFAMIHPQGFIAVPALAALGVGFALVREWRDSLWASIFMHGMHNGALVTLAVLFLQ